MELKPCPFCGCEAVILIDATRPSPYRDRLRVGCETAGCRGFYHAAWAYYETLEQAAEAWNTRAERTCRNLAEPDEVYDRPFTCSECGASGPYGEGTYHVAKTETVGKELADALGIAEGSVMHSDAWPVWKYCPSCGAKVVEE